VTTEHDVERICRDPCCGARFTCTGVGRPSQYCPGCRRTRRNRVQGPRAVEAVCEDCRNPFRFTQTRSLRRFCDGCRVRRRAELQQFRKKLWHAAKQAGLRAPKGRRGQRQLDAVHPARTGFERDDRIGMRVLRWQFERSGHAEHHVHDQRRPWAAIANRRTRRHESDDHARRKGAADGTHI
jgi:hypothetical protein